MENITINAKGLLRVVNEERTLLINRNKQMDAFMDNYLQNVSVDSTAINKYSPVFDHYVNDSQDLDRDYESGAKIVHVSPNSLPANVLGQYDPGSHTIYIANGLSSKEETYVKAHESGHASRRYNALGDEEEVKADGYAGSKTGFTIRPFYGWTRASKN
jgi:hypothetical protein